ncbi:hypothetical protein GM418_19235 [Maribellus comscasis]|uniref:MmgE/PrpD family protein n=1 Tax=Maribellus comscasis TaxID=2681766 RepID=A0A6I6JRW6_9BACT|nr:MmgE/PrpD family protein [Maribellus comscasis]QGY45726.1 hypothetical protein GM418_19235 [Maribellus comscasis]
MRSFVIFFLLFSFFSVIFCFGSDAGEPFRLHQTIQRSEKEVGDDITLALSKLAIETKADEIPDAAFSAAKAALLDALGCAFAGHSGSGVSEIIELTKYWGGREEATVWFEGTKVPITEATFANSVQLHAMDFDDYHPASDAHITAILVPTVISMGELTNSSGEEILTALIVGAEIIGRLGRAYKARRIHSGFLPTSIIGGFGATAAACRLKKCSVEETVNAMGIWYAHASGNRQALFDRTLTKRIQPGIAAKASVFAAYLAHIGITGPTRIIGEQPASLLQIYGCNAELAPPAINEIMAEYDTWQIEQLDYKRYACCGYSSKAIKTAIDFSSIRHDIKPEDIKEIRLFGDDINSPFAGVAWEDSPTPQVLAQFCVTYAAASAVKNRRYSPAEISLQRLTQDKEIDSLARRTRICSWDEWTGEPPNAPFAMHFELKDGRKLIQIFESFQRYKWPEDYNDLVIKFKENVMFSGMVDDSEVDELISEIESFEDKKNIRNFINKWLVQKN